MNGYDIVVALLLTFIVFGSIGMVIGQRKGRPAAGLFWGMLLGPIGWLLIGLGPSRVDLKGVACPHCAQRIEKGTLTCIHCGGRVTWLRGRPVRASRAA